MMFSEELEDQRGYDGIPWSTPPITVERGKETGLPSDMATITLLVRYKEDHRMLRCQDCTAVA
jgi:hypothetical protein